MTGLVDSIAAIVTPRPTALIPVANGTEEIELAGLSDVLSRGGVRVTIACVDGDEDHIVTLSKGMELQADKTIQRCMEEQYDLIVVPGGPGSTVLGHSAILGDMLIKQKHAARLYGGICAGAVDVLYHHALVTGPMTTYPAYANKVGDLYRDAAVVVAANCVTSQGPMTAIAMGLKLVELLRGENVAQDLARELVYAL